MGLTGSHIVSSSIYLDHAATTPVAPSVLSEMLPYFNHIYGNPSSVHADGRAARRAVDTARDRLAAVLDCAQREIVFTGSGSEADNLAVRGVFDRWSGERGRHIVVSAIEHDAVLESARSLQGRDVAEVTVVPCDAGCRVDPEEFAAAVRDDTVLASLMLVNNETGTVQDVAAAAEAVRRRNARTLIHTDAVQALGRIAVHPEELGVDLLSLSAHKLYGPKGAGALRVRRGVFLAAQVAGGGQERNRRSGTENVAGIVGFAAAAELAEPLRDSEAPRQASLADALIQRVTRALPDVLVTGDERHRAPGFATFAIPGCRTDLLLTVLDELGVSASGGSACSSGAPTPSHVLLAMGLPPELAAGALRCTVGRATSREDLMRAGDTIVAAVERIRERVAVS
jgi:cysteine desulfurase